MIERDDGALIALLLSVCFVCFVAGVLHEHHNQELPSLKAANETNEILDTLLNQRGCALLWTEPMLQAVYFPEWEGWNLEPLECPQNPLWMPEYHPSGLVQQIELELIADAEIAQERVRVLRLGR